MSKKIKTDKELEKYVEERTSLFTKLSTKDYHEKTLKSFEEVGLPNPFDIVREFIKEKGLKLYGGQALHEHLAKKGKPIYEDYEFPDYDVFSPDAWNHSKELCDRLYKMGFYFVETKASIVNDQKHQTYKVSVDLIYVLDLTQIGCPPDAIKGNNCDECGRSLDNKCFSFFNNIPALDILTDDKTEYIDSYDYRKGKSKFPKKMFVCSPDWLKISMYLEMTQPLQDPKRLEKVFKRLQLFEDEFKYSKCESDDKSTNKTISDIIENKLQEDPDIKKLLNFVDKFIKLNKLINYGTNAYNFYVRDHEYPQLSVNNFETYTPKLPKKYYEPLLKNLEDNFSKEGIQFRLVPRIMHWKDIDSDNYDIEFKTSSSKSTEFLPLIRFTKTNECMPYVQSGKDRYVSFDRMKYIYYKGAVLDKLVLSSEKIQRDYKCLLDNLINIELKLKKRDGVKILDGKYRPFIEKCAGGDVNKLLGNLIYNFGKSIRLSKKTQVYFDTPKNGFITKIYPAEKDAILTSYRPAEKKTKFYRKMIQFTDRHKKNPIGDSKLFKQQNVAKSFTKPKLAQKRKVSKKNKPLLRGNKKTIIKSLLSKKALLKKRRKQIKSKKYRGNKSKKTEKEIDIAIINSLSDF